MHPQAPFARQHIAAPAKHGIHRPCIEHELGGVPDPDPDVDPEAEPPPHEPLPHVCPTSVQS
jgi:hypothetical protein